MTDEMLSEGLLTTLIVDNPLAQGQAASGAAPSAKPTMVGDRSKLVLLAMPGVTTDGPEVARLLQAISAAGSWKVFTTRSIAARVPESQAIRHKARPLQIAGQLERSSEQQGRFQGGHALALAHVGGGDGGGAAGIGGGGSVTGPGAHNSAGVATGAGGSLFDGSAVLRFGYVPGRAWRAERLHGIVLDMARASLADRAGDAEAATAVACSKLPGGAVGLWGEHERPVPSAGAPTAGDVMATSAEMATYAAPPPPRVTTGAAPFAMAMAVDAAEAAAATAAAMPMAMTVAVPADAPSRGAVPGTLAARIETSQLLRSLLVTDYLALCGLGALPPDSARLLHECRRPAGVPAARVLDLPSEIERFLIGDGPQSSKASQRLGQLLGLLENLGLLVCDSSAVSSAPPGHHPTAFYVYTHAGHATWHGGLPAEGTPVGAVSGTPTEGGGPSVASAGAVSGTPTEGGGPSAASAGAVSGTPTEGGGPSVASAGAEPAPEGVEPPAALPPHLPARAHAVLSQLKEAQWSTNRPLTSLQKFRLSQANPSALATSSSAELVARADELELHPEQLLHYVQSLPSRLPKHTSTAEGGLAQAAPPKRRKSAASSVSSVSSTMGGMGRGSEGPTEDAPEEHLEGGVNHSHLEGAKGPMAPPPPAVHMRFGPPASTKRKR
ncbi:hypothetical protein Ctob_015988, partial [Chrysochromulina tobinii]